MLPRGFQMRRLTIFADLATPLLRIYRTWIFKSLLKDPALWSTAGTVWMSIAFACNSLPRLLVRMWFARHRH